VRARPHRRAGLRRGCPRGGSGAATWWPVRSRRIHPCFVGAHADRRDPQRWIIVGRYFDRGRSFDSWSPTGFRNRVGGRQVTMADLLNAVVGAGLRLERVEEDGDNGIADILGLVATCP
jgi:hypothetical protein